MKLALLELKTIAQPNQVSQIPFTEIAALKAEFDELGKEAQYQFFVQHLEFLMKLIAHHGRIAIQSKAIHNVCMMIDQLLQNDQRPMKLVDFEADRWHRLRRVIADVLAKSPHANDQPQRVGWHIQASDDYIDEVRNGEFYWTEQNLQELTKRLATARQQMKEVQQPNTELQTRLDLLAVELATIRLNTQQDNRLMVLDEALEQIDQMFTGRQAALSNETQAELLRRKALLLINVAALSDNRVGPTLEAREAIDKAMRLLKNPSVNDHPAFFVTRGQVYEDVAFFAEVAPAGCFKTAIDCLGQVVASKEFGFQSAAIERVALGRCYYRRYLSQRDEQDLKTGIDVLTKRALGKAHDYHEAERHFWLANLYDEAGDFQEADQQFKAALKIAPAANVSALERADNIRIGYADYLLRRMNTLQNEDLKSHLTLARQMGQVLQDVKAPEPFLSRCTYEILRLRHLLTHHPDKSQDDGKRAVDLLEQPSLSGYSAKQNNDQNKSRILDLIYSVPVEPSLQRKNFTDLMVDMNTMLPDPDRKRAIRVLHKVSEDLQNEPEQTSPRRCNGGSPSVRAV
ncbi:MAG: tetratricopeptide repeat protein [Pirellulaceae bacterium]